MVNYKLSLMTQKITDFSLKPSVNLSFYFPTRGRYRAQSDYIKQAKDAEKDGKERVFFI